MNDEPRPAPKEEVSATPSLPVPIKKKAELFRFTPEFIKRAVKLERALLVEFHQALEVGGEHLEIQREKLFKKYVDLFRRKLKQGRAWSKEAVEVMMTRYVDYYEKKLEEDAAKEEEGDSEAAEADSVSDEEE